MKHLYTSLSYKKLYVSAVHSPPLREIEVGHLNSYSPPLREIGVGLLNSYSPPLGGVGGGLPPQG